MSAANNSSSLFHSSPFIIDPNPIYLVLLYRYGLGLVFFLGFTGNLGSIMTFTRLTLRATSTGFLLFMVTVSDTVYLFVSIFDFVEVGITQGPIFLSNYDSLCRFRWYTKGFAQFCSAWILVLVAVDRWVGVRFPFKNNKWCTRRNALIAVVIVVVIGTGLYSHMLSAQLFGRRFPGIATEACGPLGSPYRVFYFSQWPIIQVVFVCLIPVILMLASNFGIYRAIQKSKNRLQPIGPNQPRQARLHRQMLFLMISSIIIFFATTLPVNIRVIVATHQIATSTVIDLTEISRETAILNVWQSSSYAINFYIYCLASKLFRNEFIQCIKMVHQLRGGRIPLMSQTTNHIALVEPRRNQSRI